MNFDTRLGAIEEAALQIEAILKLALCDTGTASFGVCGGKTAEAFLPVLMKKSIPWSKVDLFMVDERWVPISSQYSNEGKLRDLIAREEVVLRKIVGFKSDRKYPNEALEEAKCNYRSIKKPFDVLFLGIGEDGHIASLFPGGKENEEYNDLIVTSFSPLYPHERIGLSPIGLKNTENIVLLALGSKKRKILESAMESSNSQIYPLRHILDSKVFSCQIFCAD